MWDKFIELDQEECCCTLSNFVYLCILRAFVTQIIKLSQMNWLFLDLFELLRPVICHAFPWRAYSKYFVKKWVWESEVFEKRRSTGKLPVLKFECSVSVCVCLCAHVCVWWNARANKVNNKIVPATGCFGKIKRRNCHH